MISTLFKLALWLYYRNVSISSRICCICLGILSHLGLRTDISFLYLNFWNSCWFVQYVPPLTLLSVSGFGSWDFFCFSVLNLAPYFITSCVLSCFFLCLMQAAAVGNWTSRLSWFQLYDYEEEFIFTFLKSFRVTLLKLCGSSVYINCVYRLVYFLEKDEYM